MLALYLEVLFICIHPSIIQLRSSEKRFHVFINVFRYRRLLATRFDILPVDALLSVVALKLFAGARMVEVLGHHVLLTVRDPLAVHTKFFVAQISKTFSFANGYMK